MMSLHKLPATFARQFGLVLEKGLLNTATVTVHYQVRASDEYDRNLEDSYPQVTEQTMQLPALVHIVSATTQSRQFSQLEVGDAVLAFHPSVQLSGADGQSLPGIWFEILGQKYVTKNVGKDVTDELGPILAGQNMMRIVVVTRTT